ncbi:hypothetical protein [Carnobacterium divergens]|uniref:hypothetical protein n=1 Tax=Carnobacterium divergens TaxID=2748 RepID=UPI00288D26E3|nr:hypothetical protein [Carnobacterium divergens]MDT2011189.1 hypothetical protein [Carnobacterium divergens]
MSINLKELVSILKKTGIPVYRDDAPVGKTLPYIVYEFVDDVPSFASNRVLQELSRYQFSYITNGVESELVKIKQTLDEKKIMYSGFDAGPYDENDMSITQFNTYVRCYNVWQ